MAIYYHIQKEVLPLKTNKTHVIELRSLLSSGVGNLVASWVHRVLLRLIVCFVYFVCFKVLRLSQLVLFKFRFNCLVNNILSCRAVTEYKMMVVRGGGGEGQGV